MVHRAPPMASERAEGQACLSRLRCKRRMGYSQVRSALGPERKCTKPDSDNDRWFNLALPEARQFLTNFISAKIEGFGLYCFLNDSNIAPLQFWRAADAPDRQGIPEIRWIEGFMRFEMSCDAAIRTSRSTIAQVADGESTWRRLVEVLRSRGPILSEIF